MVAFTDITTARLKLTRLSVDDQAFIRELVNTNGWLQFIGDRKVYSTADAIGYINKVNGTPACYYWVVRLKDSYVPVGVITFMKRSYLAHFDIGFAFLPQYFGQGYAYEAAKEVLIHVTTKSGTTTILATTKPNNVSSIKLLTKLGLQFDKEIKVENNKLLLYSGTF